MKKVSFKINYNRFISFLSSLVLSTFLITITINFIRFPECYLSTWKYQLKNDIESGNAEAIAYYQNNYINNGKNLFE